MTDSELIKRAAKAAGIELYEFGLTDTAGRVSTILYRCSNGRVFDPAVSMADAIAIAHGAGLAVREQDFAWIVDSGFVQGVYPYGGKPYVAFVRGIIEVAAASAWERT